MFIRNLAVTAFTLCLGSFSWAQQAATPPRLGIAVAVGDRLTIVQEAAITTGSNVDRNQRETLRVGPEDFQRYALGVIVESFGKLRPQTRLVDMPIQAGLETLPWRREGDRLAATPGMSASLEQARVSQVLIVEPLRAPARLQMLHHVVGEGKLEGLGYYINGHRRVERTDTREEAQGYLAPYAYFRTLLVDVPSMSIRCERSTTVSHTFAAAQNQTGNDAWGALSAREKVDELRHLLREGLQESLEACLSGRSTQATAELSGGKTP